MSNAKENEYYSALKSRTIYLLQQIQGKNTEKEIEQIEDYILNLVKPLRFAGNTGIEIKFKKNFENICALLEQNLNVVNPKKLTVLEFYSKLELLKSQIQEQKRRNKK